MSSYTILEGIKPSPNKIAQMICDRGGDMAVSRLQPTAVY